MTPTGERNDSATGVLPMNGPLLPTKWRWFAMILAVAAISAQLISLKLAASAMRTMARAIDEAHPLLGNDSLFVARYSDLCNTASLALGMTAIVFWGFSLGVREPGRETVTVVLLAAWLLLFFVMV